MDQKSSSAGFLNTEDINSIWSFAMKQTAEKMRAKNIDSLLHILNSGNRNAHSLFRYFLAKAFAERLGTCNIGINKIWLFGSVSYGSVDDIRPGSDIDLIIEVDSDLTRSDLYGWFVDLNRDIGEKFNAIMNGSGIKVSGLFDVSEKIFLLEEIKEKKGFSAAVYSMYTPVNSLFDSSQNPPSQLDVDVQDLATPLIKDNSSLLALQAAA